MSDLRSAIGTAAAPAEQPDPNAKLITRDIPEPDESRRALVKRWEKHIQAARKHWDKDFKRMRRNMSFASGKQWPDQKDMDERYRANMIQRIIKTQVASLYAKNPTVVMQRRPRLDFTIWDGRPESIMQAQQIISAAGQAGPEMQSSGNAIAISAMNAAVQQAQALLADFQQGVQRQQLFDKIGKTLVTCAQYYIDESAPGFKLQMKQMMRRARTTGVGYVKLGYQREMDLSERQSAEIADMAERLAVIGRLAADLQDGECDPNSAEAEELRLATAAIQSEPEMVIREGVIFSFPHSTRLIPSISTEKLMGWVGSEWIAEEIMLTPDRVKEVYGVDIGKTFTAYRPLDGSPLQGGEMRRIADRENGLACIWEIYDKDTGMKLVICEGYPDFLEEPGTPPVFIEQFFPYFAITFNDVEDESRLFPDSDVENLTHLQKEYNRSKEARRQHRIANRPLYLSPEGALEEEEEKSLAGYAAHSVIKVRALDKGRPASDLLAPVQKIGVDPNLYETADLFEDMQRVSGNQAANIGGTSASTATESSIAENSREGALGLDSDDLDDMLTSLFRAMSQVMLTNLTAETVKKIAGPGAVWPEMSREDIAAELWLSTKAGSSGRPNAAQDAAKFERLYPLLVQIPGVSPRWLGETAVRIADDDVSIDDAIIDGLPSVLAQNAMAQAAAQPTTGNPATDPSAQGDQGKGNAPAPAKPGGTAQPAYPNKPVGGALQ